MPDIQIIPGAKEHPRKPNPHEVAIKCLTDDFTFGTVILVICWDQWGHDIDEKGRVKFMHWHPQTLRMEIDQTFGIEIPKGNFDRLMSVICILTTDMFFRNEHRFMTLCAILSGSEFDPNEIEMANVADCAWGVTEALLLDPPDDENPEPFSDAVRHYIASVLHREGFVYPPDILKIALNADHRQKCHETHGHDPELMKDINDHQKELNSGIESVIREGVVHLILQLKSLQLKNGTTTELEKRMSAMLKAL